MAWPPNPNKDPNEGLRQAPNGTQPSSQEWRLLEKTLMASIEEQRRARRWAIFFKLLTFLYLLFVVIALSKGCQPTATNKAMIGAGEPHLAVVDVSGVIASDSPANADDISEALTDAFDNPNSEAVVLNINSPGGSPVQSDEIWQTIMDLKKQHSDKKVYAIIGDMGASGAYYVASAADEIWVNPSSLVGSIGVIMPNYNVEKLLDKVGVEDRTMTSGEYKDILSMSRPISEAEKAHIQQLLDSTHQNFIDAVVAGRGNRLKNAEQNKLFSGLFWTGKQSVELGLADKLGGLNALKKELKIDNDVNYTLKDPMQQFIDRLGVQMGKGLGAGVQQSLRSDEASLR